MSRHIDFGDDFDTRVEIGHSDEEIADYYASEGNQEMLAALARVSRRREKELRDEAQLRQQCVAMLQYLLEGNLIRHKVIPEEDFDRKDVGEALCGVYRVPDAVERLVRGFTSE